MRKYARVLDKTLANITNEYAGFQSALYNPTVVFTGEHKESLVDRNY